MDTVLIVDDSAFIVEGLIALLKKNYRPLAAYGGAECLEILRREIPSVIILDIMMEPMDGWDTLSRIKENPDTRHIPVLMFSAKKISPGEAEEHRIRIDDFISKPVSPKKILEAIEKVLARRDESRKIVGRWRSAGISQEKIDEYLSLATSLEVDLSLCQNMKIQCDLAPDPENNQDEFRAVIAAVEARIRSERELIGSLAREMDEILERAAVGREIPKAGNPAITGGVEEPHAASTGTDNAPVKAPAGIPFESPVAGTVSSISDNPRNAEMAPAVPDSPGADNPGTGRRPEVPDPESVLPKISLGPAPDPAGRILPAGAGIPAAGTTGTGGPGSQPFPPQGKDGKAEEPVPEQPAFHGSGSVPPVTPVISPVTTEERKIIPADPDIRPAETTTGSLTGAGTDIPMPWANPRGRRPKKHIPEQPVHGGSPPAGTAPRAQGIFGRIVAIIRSLLGTKK